MHLLFLHAALALTLGNFFAGCSSGPKDVRVFLDPPYPRKLSEWHLFVSSADGLHPNARVVPFDLNTPLFSDYASKYRFVWMPPGSSVEYREDTVLEFPKGTIFAKSFAFPVTEHPGQERLIETRLLVRGNSGWVPLPYIWDEKQRDATLQVAPAPVEISFSDASGHGVSFTYQIPNTNQCADCHANNRVLQPIGPKARNLNMSFAYADGMENQLTRWVKAGYLHGLPPLENVKRAAKWNDPSDGTLDERARAYLDNNCAHCHQPGGTAGYTGVDFRWNHYAFTRSGTCKRPNSAGNVGSLSYDIVPGHPEESILIYRMEATAPKTMMPSVGRSVVHKEGVALLQQWIASLPVESCTSVATSSGVHSGL